MGGRSVSVWLRDFASAVGKALHSTTWLEHCLLTGGGCTLSVGREVKMEIPDEAYRARLDLVRS